MKQPEEVITGNLKRIRERRKLSLDQLAQHTGVSKSMLRQIETGKSSPTISTLWKIANGLHLSFTSLLRNPVVKGEVKNFTAAEPLCAESRRYRAYPLVSFDPRQSFEVYFFEMDPEVRFKAEPHKGDVLEYIFLFSGAIEVTVGTELFTLSSGQSLEFEADVIHTYYSCSQEISTGLMILSYRG